VLSLRAERDIDMGRVGIDIDGTPDALTSELFSEPERTDAEKLSLLLTGRSLSDTDADDGVSLADAAITLGLKRAFGVSDAIRSSVGLDELSVDGSGSDGRILAGKQLSKRIYLQYAYGVFDQLSNVLLRFQINDRLALESVSGEEQAFDLIYQVGGEQ
ncbi:MAG: translocation/assembly module TamB domain-containing protein, partial [Pseudomonadota bacterium]